MNLEKMSVAICYFLRHDPFKIELSVDKQGWADIDELIEKTKESHCVGLNREILMKIVAEDSKGRYGISSDDRKIRCLYGHSNPEVEIAFKAKTPPPVLYHGTATKSLESIMKKGIVAKTRQYVHLSSELATAIEVGRRHGKPVVLAINTHAMMKKGYSFYETDNGVWLTEFVPVQFIRP